MQERPKVMHRDCKHCWCWQYNEETGEIDTIPGRPDYPLRRRGKPPCMYTIVGCPKGTIDDQKTFHPMMRLAYEHWRECRAVGQWPDDALVRRHAAILEEVRELWQTTRHDKLVNAITAIARTG